MMASLEDVAVRLESRLKVLVARLHGLSCAVIPGLGHGRGYNALLAVQCACATALIGVAVAGFETAAIAVGIPVFKGIGSVSEVHGVHGRPNIESVNHQVELVLPRNEGGAAHVCSGFSFWHNVFLAWQPLQPQQLDWVDLLSRVQTQCQQVIILL